MSELTAWVISEGAVGMEVQAAGLVERLGAEPRVFRVAVRKPWRWLPPRLWPAALWAPGPGGDRLQAPWPDLLVSCGRKVVAIAAEIRRQSEGRCFAVHIQDPKVPLSWFDSVVVPSHDRLALRAARQGEEEGRLLIMQGSIHKITDTRLSAAAEHFGPQFAGLPDPLIGVMVGASNGHYRIDRQVADRLIESLRAVNREFGAGLAVSTSRRTPADISARLADGLRGVPHFFWSPSSESENPYFGILGLADALLVTADSVNMTTEAAATGKPVYTIDLPGNAGKFQRFHDSMREGGFTRLFEAGTLDLAWRPPRLDEAGRVAAAIRSRLEAHRRRQGL